MQGFIVWAVAPACVSILYFIWPLFALKGSSGCFEVGSSEAASVIGTAAGGGRDTSNNHPKISNDHWLFTDWWCESVAHAPTHAGLGCWEDHARPGAVNSFDCTLPQPDNGAGVRGEGMKVEEPAGITHGCVLQSEWLPCDEHYLGLNRSTNNGGSFGINHGAFSQITSQ